MTAAPALGRYNKTWAAALGTVISVVAALATGDGVSDAEWTNLAVATATVVSVFVAPNTGAAPRAKIAVAAVLLAVMVAAELIRGDGTPANWPQLIVAVLTAAGLYAVPNTEPAPTTTEET